MLIYRRQKGDSHPFIQIDTNMRQTPTCWFSLTSSVSIICQQQAGRTQIRENTVRIRMCLNCKALRKVRYLMCNKNGRKKHEKGHGTRWKATSVAVFSRIFHDITRLNGVQKTVLGKVKDRQRQPQWRPSARWLSSDSPAGTLFPHKTQTFAQYHFAITIPRLPYILHSLQP